MVPSRWITGNMYTAPKRRQARDFLVWMESRACARAPSASTAVLDNENGLTRFRADLRNREKLRRYLRTCCDRDGGGAKCEKDRGRLHGLRDVKHRCLCRQSNDIRSQECGRYELGRDECGSRQGCRLNLRFVDSESQSFWRV